MRTPRPEWVTALRTLEGCSDAEIRWNVEAGRWEFVMRGADGVPRSQFWGQFWRWEHGKRVKNTPDPVTGTYPYRDLDDAAMREALQNLSETYVANRHDGSGSVGREVRRRLQFNRDVLQRGWTLRGEAFADMAAERDTGCGAARLSR